MGAPGSVSPVPWDTEEAVVAPSARSGQLRLVDCEAQTEGGGWAQEAAERGARSHVAPSPAHPSATPPSRAGVAGDRGGEEPAGTLAAYVTALAAGSPCFCCGTPLVAAPGGPEARGDAGQGRLACPTCGASVEDAADG